MPMALSAISAKVPGAAVVGNLDPLVYDLTLDSRQVRPGWMFCAIRGSRTDGLRFAQDAVEAGACALMVDRQLDLDIPQLVVSSVRLALGDVSAALNGYPAAKLCLAGITGTNGKTTTGYLLHGALRAGGRDPGLIGSIELRTGGVPHPSLATTPEAPDLHRSLGEMVCAGMDSAVMEVSSHGLDQHRVDGICFDVAVFMNLAAEHLDYHGTIEQYWFSKSQLFKPERCSRAVICVDDQWGMRLASQAKVPILTFARAGAPDVVYRVTSTTLSGTTVVVDLPEGELELFSPVVGAVNGANMTAAYLAARELGVPSDLAAKGIASSMPVPGRFEIVDAHQRFLVVVDYAHTPEALKALIATAHDLSGMAEQRGRVHVVVGARGGRDRLKRPEMGRVAAAADRAILTVDSPGEESPKAIIDQMLLGTLDASGSEIIVLEDRREAIIEAIAGARAGDVVLLVGRGHERVQHFGGKDISFDDRLVALEALRSLGYHPGSLGGSRPVLPGASKLVRSRWLAWMGEQQPRDSICKPARRAMGEL